MLNLFILLWQTPTPPQGGAGLWGNLVFIGAGLAVVYFMMLRPQSKLRKEQSDFSNKIKKGQKIVTMGGIHGTIASIDEELGIIKLIIAEGTYIKIQKDSVSMDMTKNIYGAKKSKESAKSDK